MALAERDKALRDLQVALAKHDNEIAARSNLVYPMHIWFWSLLFVLDFLSCTEIF